MPRIKADNIVEHVAQQRAAVLDAAVRLFIDRGYAEVGLGDIAAEVGLARNSLYRYVPDKSHLLVEWFRRSVPDAIAAWDGAVAGDDPPEVRLQRWAGTYLAWARSPEHQLVGPLMDALSSMDDATRAEVAALHATMMDVVARVVAEAGVPAEEVDGAVDLLSGVVLGAARTQG
ncbi:MAG: TetR/AcrR family transcriptional regulator, partial [Actinobacteria bacterium]|nr:TetR/AcrR family transcriptional regulator [Actinomycetota bacterium]